MLGRVKRHWWRFVGTAFVFTALWFYLKAREVDQQWDQQIAETESKWKEIDKQTMEKIEAHRKADRLEKSRLEGEIIYLQTENYTLQRESLRKTRDLYVERSDYDTIYFILTLIGFLIIQFGLWRDGLRWKRRYQALRAS